ncbi:MAG: hypothetical protein K2X38_15385, partial [Gemmataceae bacterium]|nr:hypothetical protein [Gemmataceae bacterium]
MMLDHANAVRYSRLFQAALAETEDVGEAMLAAQLAMDAAVGDPIGVRLATDGDGEWITIGGKAEGEEKHVGGFPVFIKDGVIVKGGPRGLKGKKVSEVKAFFDGEADSDEGRTNPAAAPKTEAKEKPKTPEWVPGAPTKRKEEAKPDEAYTSIMSQWEQLEKAILERENLLFHAADRTGLFDRNDGIMGKAIEVSGAKASKVAGGWLFQTKADRQKAWEAYSQLDKERKAELAKDQAERAKKEAEQQEQYRQQTAERNRQKGEQAATKVREWGYTPKDGYAAKTRQLGMMSKAEAHGLWEEKFQVGDIIAVGDQPHVIVKSDRPSYVSQSDAEDFGSGKGGWSFDYEAVPVEHTDYTQHVFASTARRKRLAEVEKHLRGMVAGPDDDRNREQHDEEYKALLAEEKQLKADEEAAKANAPAKPERPKASEPKKETVAVQPPKKQFINPGDEIGSYKGKKYRVLYIGKTKFGQRARLQFMDGSKDFWVDAKAVSLSLNGAEFSLGDADQANLDIGIEFSDQPRD